MQSEVIRYSRLGVLVAALGPAFAAVVLLRTLGSGSVSFIPMVVGGVFALFFLYYVAEVIKPRELELDSAGFTYRPTFGTSTRVDWGDVSAFSLTGKKNRVLVCEYRDAASGAVKQLKLGEFWALPDSGLWYASSDKVMRWIGERRQSATQRTLPRTSQASSGNTPAKPRTTKPVQSGGVAVSARSGVTYASSKAPAEPKPQMPILNGDTGAGKGLGWGLLIGGCALGVMSVGPFMAACRSGLCSAGLWEVGDVRIWAFAGLWTLCLLLVIAGGRLITARNDTL